MKGDIKLQNWRASPENSTAASPDNITAAR